MFKKIISVILSITIFLGIFSCSTTVLAIDYNEYAASETYKENLLNETIETETEQAKIVCEVPEKRDEYSKTYKRADGSYTSVISASPIHKLKNGKWAEIDNTLKTEGEVLKNNTGSFDVEFPETITENEKITITNDGESVAFSVNEIESAKAVVKAHETDEKDIIQQDLSKTVSEITYEEIDENTDIQYIVSSDSVKENIIVNDKASLKDTYSFKIEKGNLAVFLDDENNITFKNNKNEAVFTIPAPVMSDATGTASRDIAVTLENAESKVLTLTYTPSKEWLNSNDIVYPVFIDPVIIMPDTENTIIEDTVIKSDASAPESKTTNYVNSAEGYICDNAQLKSNILVKLNMDVFGEFKKSNVEVTDVNFFGTGIITGGNVLVKPIAGNWNSSTITYDDVYPDTGKEPVITYENTVTDYFTGASPDADETLINVNFNITSLFNEWLSGRRANAGFAIVPENTTTNGSMFIGGDILTPGDNSLAFSSYVSVDYAETAGCNDSFEYLNQQIGRAGMASVNTFSRGLSIARSDIALNGLHLPAEIAFNYNNALTDFLGLFNSVNEIYGEVLVRSPFGNNWSSSYLQMLFELDANQYLFYTAEGALVTFNKTEEAFTDENNEETTEIVFEADATSDYGYNLELIDKTGSCSYDNMQITDPTGNSIRFNDDGFATAIKEYTEDSTESTKSINITYETEIPYAIDYVTDGAGRKYDFIYNSSTSLLTEIRCITSDGSPIKAGTTNMDLKVNYTYDDSRNLTAVTYPDGESVAYTYDLDGNLIKVQNIDSYNIQYTYDTLSKVTEIKEYADNTPGNSITLTQLSNRQVRVDDDFYGSTTYQFGKNGKLHYTFDEKGNYQKSDDATASDENVYETGDWKIASENLLLNGSFEDVSGITSSRAKFWSDGFTRTEYETAPTGEYVYCISSDNASTQYLEQTVDVKNVAPYTLSADVKGMPNADATGNLYLKIIAIDESQKTRTQMQSIEKSEDWTRVSVTFDPTGVNDTFEVSEIIVCIGFENSCGTYYVDNVQLETGKGTGEYNLVENGSFNHVEDRSLYQWSEGGITQSNIYGKSVNAVVFGSGLPYYTKSGDIYTLNDSVSAITQNVKINGKKGDVYSVGGWFMGLFDDNSISPYANPEYAESTPQLTNSLAQIKVTYSYVNTETGETLTENFVVDFAPNNVGWQYASDSFALKGDVEAVDVTVISQNLLTESYATGIELTKNEDAMSFDFDDETNEDDESTEEVCICGCEECVYGENCPCTGAINNDCQCSECLRKETTAEDSFGNTISNRSSDGINYIETLSSYTTDGNYIASFTDENGNVTTYDYNTLSSVLQSVTSPMGTGSDTTTTHYEYSEVGNLVSVSTDTSESESQALEYVYTDDRLKEIITPNGKFRIAYDLWGQILSVSVVVSENNQEKEMPLVEYSYDTGVKRTQVLSVAYPNSTDHNNVYEYFYDDFGEVKLIILNNSEKHIVTHNNLGELTEIKNVGGRTVQYTDGGVNIYNAQDVLVYTSVTDEEDLVTEENYGVKYKEIEASSDYNATNGNYEQTSGWEINQENRIENKSETDWFGREKSYTTTVYDISGENENTEAVVLGKITTEYEYPLADDGKSSSIIEKYINKAYNGNGSEHSLYDGYYYEYDKQNKISAEKKLNSDGTTTDRFSYEYDKLGQLVRYNDAVSNKTYGYTYDSNGNILTKSEYAYTLGSELGTATNTTTYAYDSLWKDRLASVNDKIIKYDDIGNPTSYLGATLTWESRNLTSYENEEYTIRYEYDESGMRYRSTITTIEDGKSYSYEYVWLDGKLISIVYVGDGTTQTAKYLYGDFGEPVGMVVTKADGEILKYFYLKNAQGDITHIVSENGRKVVEFTYDAFGNRVIHYEKNTSTIVGMMNFAEQIIVCTLTPFAYRGYCYDVYSGLYYLQSRYYDPQTGRFINADDTNYLNATGTVLGCNLFAYCENDPVNFVDPEGTTIEIDDEYKKDYYAKKAFKLLKKLTDDTLVYKNGKVTIKRKCESEKIKKYYGTYLIRSLIKSTYIVTIRVINKKYGSSTLAEHYNNSLYKYKKNRYSNGKGSHTIIDFYLKDTAKSFKNPLYIILAHELIHAYRDVNGMSIDMKFICKEHSTEKKKCYLEECFVVGLHSPHYRQYFYSSYTENNIRLEHGLKRRTKYIGW